MVDVFNHIEWKVRKEFGEDPVCVHVGNPEECDIKRHPTYSKLRDQAISAGVRSSSTSRLWESLIAMGRLCDLDGGEIWRLVILDCITPCFRSLSTRISRDFKIDREEIRSAMVVDALEVWQNTSSGFSPRHVRDRMVKAAFDAAFNIGSSTSADSTTGDMETLMAMEVPVAEWVLKTSSIIYARNIRDADVREQLEGERFGALLQAQGHSDAPRTFHEELRAGRRSGSISQTVKARLPRAWISDPNLYYYTSDLYPAFIGLRDAAFIMGIPESAAHRLIRAGHFPFPAARVGRGYKVSVKALMHFSNIPDSIVHVDDVENGALHAGGRP